MMGNVGKFLDDLKFYDKKNIHPDCIKALMPYLEVSNLQFIKLYLNHLLKLFRNRNLILKSFDQNRQQLQDFANGLSTSSSFTRCTSLLVQKKEH